MHRILRQTYLSGLARRNLHLSGQKNGYIVLVPEIGEDSQGADVMLKADGLPAFNNVNIENCLGAIGAQAAAVESVVKRIEGDIVGQQSANTSDIFKELDEVTGPLDTTWGIAKALYLGNSNLIPTKSYMNIHERARNARASKYSSQHIYKHLKEKLAQTQLVDPSNAEHRLLQKYSLEGKLNGLTLGEKEQHQLREVISNLGKERANFKNKVNMAMHTFSNVIKDYQLVRDFPLNLLEAIAVDSNHPTQGPWKVTLQPQLVEGFLRYCPDRQQRWNIWQADVRKCSNQLEKSLENSTHVEKIRSLRKRQANLLGYPTFADMSMQTKMVQSVENLNQIFAKLLQFAGPAQSVEIEHLQNFALNSGFEYKLDLFDVPYWQRKYLIREHQLDEQVLREYFPLPRVFSGLFALSEKLFNIKIVQRENAEVWQPTVKYYDVFDVDAKQDGPVGGFYVDCYSKENKFGKNNGWMVSIRNRNEAAKLTPLCAMIFNFCKPADDKSYLLTMEDMRMVCKTFGTTLQHMLTRASYTDLAGLSNIEWDASQISANVLTNFLDNPEILKTLSGHYRNDETLPDSLAKATPLLKTHMAGYNLCQEIYIAHLDIELHKTSDFWLDVVKKLWPVYRCMPFDKKDSHPCSMTEIFSGDWAAAQFSHLYSKMIAADISAAFDIDGADMSTVGKRFKETFLASGGTVPSAEVFRRFRGRDPSVEALLKSLDVLHTSQTSGEL